MTFDDVVSFYTTRVVTGWSKAGNFRCQFLMVLWLAPNWHNLIDKTKDHPWASAIGPLDPISTHRRQHQLGARRRRQFKWDRRPVRYSIGTSSFSQATNSWGCVCVRERVKNFQVQFRVIGKLKRLWDDVLPHGHVVSPDIVRWPGWIVMSESIIYKDSPLGEYLEGIVRWFVRVEFW
jgi:hypothetical protein